MINERPFAGCPVDRTPLIATFEVPKKEWHCMTCGQYFEWLSARGVPATPEVKANYDDLMARFKAGERGMARRGDLK